MVITAMTSAATMDIQMPSSLHNSGNSSTAPTVSIELPKGAQKGDDGGGQPVVQGREEGRAIDGEAREQEREGEDAEGVGRHLEQARVIAHIQPRQGSGQYLARREHAHGARGQQAQAAPQQAPRFSAPR